MRLCIVGFAVGCSGAMLGPDALLVDADGDGWTPANGDCDDANPSVFPTAPDAPGDDIDQNCDGFDAEGVSVQGLAEGDLRITEIMLDPLGVDPALGEWLEVRNTLDLPVDLMGLLIRDDARDDTLVTQSLVVQPGDVVVFGGGSDPLLNGGAEVDALWDASFGLSRVDSVVLDVDGRVIDRVAYDLTWPVEEGRSLSLSAGEGASDAPTDWCAASELYGVGGYGSPGTANPACPEVFEGLTAAELVQGDLVITEILQAPAASSGDYGEWIEVHNTTAQDIDLRGIELLDETGSGARIEGAAVVPALGYAVLAASLDRSLNGGVDAIWAWGWEYSLRNSGQTVRLVFGTLELDAVAYDNGYTFPDPSGASMSLDPDALSPEDNDDGDAWCTATVPFGDGDLGTPGAVNPPCSEVLRVGQLGVGDLVVTEIMASPAAGEEGEWVEIYNAAALAVDLGGLVLSDGSGSFTVPLGVLVSPGDFVVLGQSEQGSDNGGAPVDVAYGDAIRWGAADTVMLTASGLVVDEVEYDATFGGEDGASLSLRPNRLDASDNDTGQNWCTSTSSFGAGDLGTPGTDNDAC
jgi:hypothetical protein